jgi:tRNA modification GTPase
MVHSEDTIAAISTPTGKGGLAVLRISGPDAVRIAGKIFQSTGKQTCFKNHRTYHGWIKEGKESIDEVVMTLFQAPDSYTGEDVVEISCHGGIFVSRCILKMIIAQGARPAEPGEFTQRAFMNGKIDLSQAEAVADLIQSQTEASRRVAVYQLEGKLSEKLNKIREDLIRIVSLLEIELDFGEEDVQFANRNEIQEKILAIKTEIDKLIRTYERGRVCREGIRMVILGRPNVGKSSILNVLLEKERAIVTEIPGTTRDLIEDILDIEGILFAVTDTAGIRGRKNVSDPIEKEGILRSEKALQSSDLVLLVFDNSQPIHADDESVIRLVRRVKKEVITVINKTDLKSQIEEDRLREHLNGIRFVRVSALNREGIDTLIQILKDQALSEGLPKEGELVLTSLRHRNSLVRANESIAQAEKSLRKNMSQEFIALDLRGALESIGEITGQTTPEDVLNHIFSEFCIGK